MKSINLGNEQIAYLYNDGSMIIHNGSDDHRIFLRSKNVETLLKFLQENDKES